MAWFSGLIRGAVAFAMVLRIDTAHRDVLVSTVMLITLGTTLFLSAMLTSFTKFVGLNTDKDETNTLIERIFASDEYHYEQKMEKAGLSKFHKFWNRIDSAYF